MLILKLERKYFPIEQVPQVHNHLWTLYQLCSAIILCSSRQSFGVVSWITQLFFRIQVSNKIYAALLPRIGKLQVVLDNKESLLALYQLLMTMSPQTISAQVQNYNFVMSIYNMYLLMTTFIGKQGIIYEGLWVSQNFVTKKIGLFAEVDILWCNILYDVTCFWLLLSFLIELDYCPFEAKDDHFSYRFVTVVSCIVSFNGTYGV